MIGVWAVHYSLRAWWAQNSSQQGAPPAFIHRGKLWQKKKKGEGGRKWEKRLIFCPRLVPVKWQNSSHCAFLSLFVSLTTWASSQEMSLFCFVGSFLFLSFFYILNKKWQLICHPLCGIFSVCVCVHVMCLRATPAVEGCQPVRERGCLWLRDHSGGEVGGGGQEPHTSLRRLTSLPMVGARATVRVVAPASPPCIAVASAKPQQISNTRTDHSQISPLFRIHSCTPHSHFLLPNPLCQHPGSLSPYLLLLILSASLLSLQSHHLSLSVSPRHTHTHTHTHTHEVNMWWRHDLYIHKSSHLHYIAFLLAPSTVVRNVHLANPVLVTCMCALWMCYRYQQILTTWRCGHEDTGLQCQRWFKTCCSCL